jgi:hypothetical protein
MYVVNRRQTALACAASYIATFCDGKLGILGVTLTPPKFGTWADTLSEMTAALGGPSVRTASAVNADGRYRSVDYVLPAHNGESEILIILGYLADSTYVIQRNFRHDSICPQ